MLIVSFHMFFLKWSYLSGLPKLIYIGAQIGAAMLGKKQVLAAIEHPNLTTFNKNVMMVS